MITMVKGRNEFSYQGMKPTPKSLPKKITKREEGWSF